jgi:hypothetical protein
MSVEWQQNAQTRRGLSWRELVDQAARMLGFEDPELVRARGDDLQILEYFRIKKHQEFAELRNWFYEEIHAPDEALRNSPIHAALAKLERCHLFYTTNYDDFLERSFAIHGRQCSAVAVEAHIAEVLKSRSRGQAIGDCEIVKFHGDLSNPSRMVLSESDYEKRLRFAEVEDQRLKSDMLGRALLFIGYSFRDWNVSYLFRLVNDQFGDLPSAPTGRRAYIAVSAPSDFEYELFRARNIEVLPIRRLSMTEDIVEILKELAR